MNRLSAIDLFSGCGGLSEGVKEAGINVQYAVEIDPQISKVYEANHPQTRLLNLDIRKISDDEFKKMGKGIHIVAGCPPCQGFTKINSKNKKRQYSDERNLLILEYFRAIRLIEPEFIMMENVPEIIKYDKFNQIVKSLKELGYNIDYHVINVKFFGVPQNRKRLVLVGSKHYKVNLPEKESEDIKTVRDAIGKSKIKHLKDDKLQLIYSHHTDRIKKIISMIPKDGGSRKDLPYEYWLECHKKKNVGFSDVYGRMSWEKPAPTITGGCLSPSKGRFLHPDKNRSISAREAALLQSFPSDYIFDTTISKALLAQMIGNAIPPKVAKFQGKYILALIEENK